MSTFKVGDRVMHDTKGPAIVVSVSKDQILLELANEVGSTFKESASGMGFKLAGNDVKAGNYYWWPSTIMVTLLYRKTFKGNCK